MWRIRVLRVVLPALLIPFVVLLILELRPRRAPGFEPPPQGDEPVVVARGVDLTSLEGERTLFDLDARTYLEPREGHQKVEGVDRLELFREDASPLLMTADLADIRGEPPNRVATVEGGLRVRDAEAGMEVDLPILEIDEAAREARSRGEVRFRAPDYRGTAESVVYPLDDRPTVFHGLELDSATGESMRARTARMHRDSDEIELSGDVRFSSPTGWVEGPRMHLRRDPDEGWVREVRADRRIRGEHAPEDGPATAFLAGHMEATWSERGRVARAELRDDVRMTRGDGGIVADRLVAVRPDDDPTAWRIAAGGGVVVTDAIDGVEATLRAREIEARTDGSGAVVSGIAVGEVRFRQGDAFGTAARAELSPGDGSGRQAALYGAGDRKARFAQADRRVAADVIRTRPGTRWMRAEGRAEATLLPAAGRAPAATAVFTDGEAVHFVSRALESDDTGSSLRFRGDVRGWQGERNLSADEVRYHRRSSRMVAVGAVATRLPLREEATLSQADFIQISSDRFEYDDVRRAAVYEGTVRARQDLGWLECDRLEVHVAEDGRGISRLAGFGDVELEYRVRGDSGMPRPVRGTADRIEYLPETETVVLYGDRRPATLRSEGPDGGVTEGRVIRYGLIDGRREVEGGARIRTGEREDGT